MPEIPVEEGHSWEREGKGGFGIRMLIRDKKPCPLAYFTTDFAVDLGKLALLCCGSPSVNRSNNSSLLQLEVAGLNPLMFVKCSDIRVMEVL